MDAEARHASICVHDNTHPYSHIITHYRAQPAVLIQLVVIKSTECVEMPVLGYVKCYKIYFQEYFSSVYTWRVWGEILN